ncbi:MAG: CoA transferase [Chloroflexi bacterium]|nr:CoA transferase [Chloroflexota bacterium]
MVTNNSPLSGIRVLDLTQMVAGPCAAMLLADAGAEVIKIERPGTGEISRGVGTRITNEKGQSITAAALAYCRNRKAMTLDLKSERGKEIFLKLVKVSDVVLENFAPPTMLELGLDYAVLKQVNPAIIYASVSGFGHLDILPSPFWNRPAFNYIVQAMSGLADGTGEEDGPPVTAQASIGDIFPGTLAVVGILIALYQRQHTQLGQRIDVSMYDAMVSMMTTQMTSYIVTGNIPARGQGGSAPNGLFRVKDGYVAISAFSEPLWRRFCDAIGKPELVDYPGLEHGTDRGRNLETVLRPIIEGWAADKTKQEVTEVLLGHNVPAGPVQTLAEVVECPHVKARQMLIAIEHPVAGRVKLVGSPIKMSTYPNPTYTPPPLLGEHTDEILAIILGMTEAQIQELRSDGAI